MAAREFHAIIRNQWNTPLIWTQDHLDGGDWQNPWQPSGPFHGGVINPGQEAEWRAESDGFMTGTSGWAYWRMLVDTNDGPPHEEFFQITWDVPFLGAPYVTCTPFHSDPRNAEFPDGTPPDLRIRPISRSSDGSPSVVIPAVIAAPIQVVIFDLLETVSELTIVFVVEPRPGVEVQAPIPVVAPPNRQQLAMETFRRIAQNAAQIGFVGAFPNFDSKAVFVTPNVATWKDVALAELNGISLEDFEGRMRETHAYATRNGFVGGFPNFYHADAQFVDPVTGARRNAPVCGTVLLNAEGAEWRDVPLSELGNPALDDFEARFKATYDYAIRNGFVGGFPNLYHAEVQVVDPVTGFARHITVCGTILLKKDIQQITADGGMRAKRFAELRSI